MKIRKHKQDIHVARSSLIRPHRLLFVKKMKLKNVIYLLLNHENRIKILLNNGAILLDKTHGKDKARPSQTVTGQINLNSIYFKSIFRTPS